MFFLLSLLIFSSPIDDIKLDTTGASENKINRIIKNMSLDEKIGQLLIFGFSGINAKTEATKLIEKYKPGGVLLFSRNVENKTQLVILNKTMQEAALKYSGVPLFISVDQEGGRVLRLKNIATVLPGNMNLGATDSSILSFLAGKLTAIDLEALGINMNFAPVIDVNSNKDSKVIGVRSFGDDPKKVSELGVAYIKGLQSRRVSATAKHYPGHGAVSGDSHYSSPSIDLTFDELYNRDLIPFKAAISDGVDAIMTAHLSYPNIDPTNNPATISKIMLTDILRNKLGFTGLIVTDDMEMNGISSKMDIGEASVKAILAGCDLITVAWSETAKEKVFNSLKRAVENSIISESRINESLKRIIATKLKRKLYQYPDPNIEKIKQIVGNKFHNQIARLIAKKSITLLKNDSVIPIETEKKYLIISNFEYFASELNTSANNTIFLKMKLNSSKKDREAIYSKIIEYKDSVDAIIISVMNSKQAELANNIKEFSNKPLIVASLDTPYLIKNVYNADAYICSYSFRSKAVTELASVILGKTKAMGLLPVKLN